MLLVMAIKVNKWHVPACQSSLLHCGILSTQSLVPLLFSSLSIFLPPPGLLAHVFPCHSLLLLSTLLSHCSLRFKLCPYKHTCSLFYVHQLHSTIRCIKSAQTSCHLSFLAAFVLKSMLFSTVVSAVNWY